MTCRHILEQPSAAAESTSLRDWFAGLAMQAIMTTQPDTNTWGDNKVAGDAYNIADAMLEARAAPVGK